MLAPIKMPNHISTWLNDSPSVDFSVPSTEIIGTSESFMAEIASELRKIDVDSVVDDEIVGSGFRTTKILSLHSEFG